MTDFSESLQGLAEKSNIVRVLPNEAYQVVDSGTTNVVAEGNADAIGTVHVDNLPSGHYDLKIKNTIVKSFHHVTYSYASKFPRTWVFHVPGSITSGSGESPDIPVYVPGVVGRVDSLNVSIQHIGDTGNITIHLLTGGAAGGTALSVPADSVYSYQAFPQVEQYRHGSGRMVPDPAIILSETQALTIGWEYTAGTVEGLTVEVVFKPT